MSNQKSSLTITASSLLGAVPSESGVLFRVWAPKAHTVEVVLEEGSHTAFPLEEANGGFFEGVLSTVKTGSLYRYTIDGKGPYPDPASRFQPQGVHGPSQVVDPRQFHWSDSAWQGHALKNLILYELHVGTFTPAGTFAGMMERLPYLADLGITALELMPVADFPGRRNWGYDGVSLFAPAHHYGEPDDLRRVVDRAHELGMSVLLDVVYNHLGPDGNYLEAFSPYYFTSRHHTPWGSAVNLDGEQSQHVRHFFIENAVQWIRDYHIDGLRLDATHAMIDNSRPPFLAELTERVHADVKPREVVLIAEDCRNLACIVTSVNDGGWGLDAVWSDDFHHEVRRSLAKDKEGYFQDFSGHLQEIATTLKKGWYFSGQPSVHFGRPRGTKPDDIPLQRFVFCLQNHDQIGNRAFGERLNQQIDPASYRAASTLLLTVPETPLLFMGQEWGAGTPFLYFTDHHDELGTLVTKGRRAEFKAFKAFTDVASRDRIPDPQDPDTFRRSVLQWSELTVDPHTLLHRLYRALVAWRKNTLTSMPIEHGEFTATVLDDTALRLQYRRPELACYEIIIQWEHEGTHRFPIKAEQSWEVVLTTEDPYFCNDTHPIRVDRSNGELTLQFLRPGAVILKTHL